MHFKGTGDNINSTIIYFIRNLKKKRLLNNIEVTQTVNSSIQTITEQVIEKYGTPTIHEKSENFAILIWLTQKNKDNHQCSPLNQQCFKKVLVDASFQLD
ncbi:MAG: hypothetical protein KZQ56_07340 [gamma proteobacterium symbiont of Lucinoma myriamae]|nr:hypothetical protein [gamma proteobacterium symbiont of Lucinoma myriamae]